MCAIKTYQPDTKSNQTLTVLLNSMQ